MEDFKVGNNQNDLKLLAQVAYDLNVQKCFKVSTGIDNIYLLLTPEVAKQVYALTNRRFCYFSFSMTGKCKDADIESAKQLFVLVSGIKELVLEAQDIKYPKPGKIKKFIL